jgi:uncharacterized protein YneF (UPF0154 family)
MYIALFTFLPRLSENENTKNLLMVVLPLISIIGTIIAGIISQYFVSPSKLSVVAQMENLGATLGPPVFSYFLTLGRDSLIIIVMVFSLLGAMSGMFITKKQDKP